MIWFVIFIIILIVSFFLAFRSMKGFQEYPVEKENYSLFLIRNLNAITAEVLEKIYQISQKQSLVFAFEKLIKGSQKALVLYAPPGFVSQFPELDCIELENYLSDHLLPADDKKIMLNDSLAWVLKINKNMKLNINDNFLKDLDLLDDQYLILQIVCQALKEKSFHVTFRAMVVEKKPTEKVKLAKNVMKLIEDYSNLKKDTISQPTKEVFNAFNKRAFTPKEIEKLSLTEDEILQFIKV